MSQFDRETTVKCISSPKLLLYLQKLSACLQKSLDIARLNLHQRQVFQDLQILWLDPQCHLVAPNRLAVLWSTTTQQAHAHAHWCLFLLLGGMDNQPYTWDQLERATHIKINEEKKINATQHTQILHALCDLLAVALALTSWSDRNSSPYTCQHTWLLGSCLSPSFTNSCASSFRPMQFSVSPFIASVSP